MAASSSVEEPAMAAATEAKLPSTGLHFDTGQAAKGSDVEGMGYIGVWAEDAAGCAAVDQPAGQKYVVITSSTVRVGDTPICYGSNQPLVDGKRALGVTCTGNRHIDVNIAMSTPDTLVFNGSPPLVRCQP